MSRVALVVLDSVGIGGAPDAEAFGDLGANTLGNIASACARSEADIAGQREGPLDLPNLLDLGIGHAVELATGKFPEAMPRPATVIGQWGVAIEESTGKDTPSGHWEMAGQPIMKEWHTFANSVPAFPDAIIQPFIRHFDLPGVLGNRHASGTEILEDLGDEHVNTGKPIVYTSVDSVFQIAAHEESFGVERLYALCSYMRTVLDEYNVGRVIARPFLGDNPKNYQRTANRKDYSMPPPSPTLLDRLAAVNRSVISIGKIADIFAHRSTGEVVKAGDNNGIFDATLEAMSRVEDGGLVFSNFVDFDSVFGHRRNVPGYARALEEFDERLPELRAVLNKDDRVIITADHGCDPTLPGSDHTRETVPILAFGPDTLLPDVKGQALGHRSSFADIGQAIAGYLNVSALTHGTAWQL